MSALSLLLVTIGPLLSASETGSSDQNMTDVLNSTAKQCPSANIEALVHSHAPRGWINRWVGVCSMLGMLVGTMILVWDMSGSQLGFSEFQLILIMFMQS